jgi:hypothetical protein
MPFMHTPPGPHWIPHLPQLNAFELRSTHALLQLVRPLSHETVHIESEHTWPGMHAVVQEPQCVGSLVVSVQTPLQRCWPGPQLHAPETQVVPPRHTMPQPPQLIGSVLVSTHAWPHTVWLAAHCVVHAELEQTSPFWHTTPHLPQLSGSLVVSTHAPPQLVSMPGHAMPPHTPSAHTAFGPQKFPHLPQLSGSLDVSTHAPKQSVSMPGHVLMPH